eukprot:GGOE01007202.1.p1 GENE.GGOE01007202.1~~GGOE01007202.1.p1  ORF type:complete len:427 (-),score=83.07 GGOE01007202.1:1344-2492(-)
MGEVKLAVSKPKKLNLPKETDIPCGCSSTPATPATPCTPCTPCTPGKKSTMADFKLLTVLGRGSYGKVVKARRKNGGHIVAIKMMQREELIKNDVLEWVEQEKKVVDKIQRNPHPFVSNVEETFRTKALIVHVMEFLPGGDLSFHLQQAKNGKFSTPDAKFYFAEVALAIHHLHVLNIIYRDLKPDNVLLHRDGHVALADFGFAKLINSKDPQQTAFCGSLEYLAPEMIHSDVKPYSFEVDWWSAGVLLYNLLTGSVPWTSEKPVVCYDKICKAPLPKRKLGEEEFAFLSQMLAKDLNERLRTFEAIKSHPFMSDIDWDKLEKRDIPPPFVPDLTESDTKYFDKDLTSLPAQVSIVSGQPAKTEKDAGKGNGNGEGKRKKRK